jgi:hypothetical protein
LPWWLLLVVAVLGLGIASGGLWLHRRLVSDVRDELLPTWSRDYNSTVTLDHLSIWVFPSIQVTGDSLTFRLHGRDSEPPLLHARRITATAGILEIFHAPHHLHLLDIRGLELNVPPDRPWNKAKEETSRSKFYFDEIRADGGILRKLPRERNASPLEFQFPRVRLHTANVNSDIQFDTEVRIPKPPGVVRAHGQFGPWDIVHVGEMQASGHYELSHADLSVFHPVLGTLESNGEFRGRLKELSVAGHAEIPSLETRNAQRPIAFHADYRATVDGTTGDTRIESIGAAFLHSKLVAHGDIRGKVHKIIALDAEMPDGRLEDILRFVLRDPKPLFTGSASFHWQFTSPLTSKDVVHQMRINGSVSLANVEPAKEQTREKLDSLSAKGQGEPQEAASITVESNVHGMIDVRDGVARLSNVSFRTPGMLVTLHGTYQLLSEELNLSGTARLEAKLSQTTTGFKSVLLKTVDPFFKKKNAGAAVPVRITGPARNPNVRTDIF